MGKKSPLGNNHWTREVVVQRFLHKQKVVVPFVEAAKIDCSQYSILLERAVVDFGADLSFGQAEEMEKSWMERGSIKRGQRT